jgi:heme iron utilization protein
VCDKYQRSSGARARRLLLREYYGVLSTHSVDAPGYPFGSVAPYCLDRTGQPIIQISRIAQHTKNILANPKVSLIVAEDEPDDVQAAARLTFLANAQSVTEDWEDVAARYYEYFPDSRGYHATHDFDFYCLNLVRGRYIGGFGDIHWLKPADLLLANPFDHTEESRIVRHMNEDHVEAMRQYCRQAHIPLDKEQDPVFAGADAEGFHLRIGTKIARFEFVEQVSSVGEVRAALVAMARQA